jgi:large subunit ribosomal protein L6
MSRVSKVPIDVPAGSEIRIGDGTVTIKGPKGELSQDIHSSVEVALAENQINVSPRSGAVNAEALAGTMRALLNNMVIGVNQGFERKLELVGVGYRAQMKGNVLNLALGFSHPVDFKVPDGISIEAPSQTEVVVRGIDKQQVGQVSAIVRGFRPPEPYKGKGVRYAGERIIQKVAKKK